jgi:hypothetical protein
MLNIESLHEYGFFHSHDIVLQSGNVIFKKLRHSKELPSIYTWMACSPGGEYKTLYVGKAGKGVHIRCAQHASGFINSSTGMKNASELMHYLQLGFSIRVYARYSDVHKIFGQDVSLYSAEENALCALLNPILNRALFPSVKIENDGGDCQLLERSYFDECSDFGELVNSRLIQSTTEASDDFLAQLNCYSQSQYLTAKELLIYVDKILPPEFLCKLVGSYANQPVGCNGQTTMTFGIPGKSGAMKSNTWKARLYFGAEPRIGFNISFLKSNVNDFVDVSNDGKIFSPRSSKDFLKNPDSFLKLSEF